MSRTGVDVLNATVTRLLLASAIIALGTSGFIIAVPYFVLAKIGRADAVGYVTAASTLGYIVSCLLSQPLAQRISPRLIVTAAVAGVALFLFSFQFTATVPQMFGMLLLYGLCLGLVWAPLMGWLSGDAEGLTLSKRLGLFNIAWSFSIIFGPLAASYMVKHSIEMPFTAMMIVLALASLIVLTTPYTPPAPQARKHAFPASARSDNTLAGQPLPAAPPANDLLLPTPLKTQYIRYLAWVGAFVGYLAVGLYRFQMPHLAETLHIDKVVFGRIATALSLAITLAFFMTARWTGWHGRTRWIFVPQIVLVAVAVAMTWTTSPSVMIVLMMAVGFCAGLLYASSVFHGSLGAAPALRIRRMAIHEVCLNIGIITGSLGGNQLSQHLGPSRVYPYLAVTIALVVIAQAIGWNWLAVRHARRARLAAPATDTASLALNPALTRQQ